MRAETRLIIASTCVALLIGELIIGQFYPQRTVKQFLHDRPAMYQSDETLFMGLKPNFNGFLKEDEFRTDIIINDSGYRQDKVGEKQDTLTRTLVVGDSFTFGYGVEEEESYPRIVEHIVNATSERKIEIINSGVPTWWVDAYYLYLKTRGMALQPDIVLLGLFMGNDIDTHEARAAIWPQIDEYGRPLSIYSGRVRIENGYRVRKEPRARWRIPVLRNSHLFQLLYSSVKHAIRAVRPRVQAETMYASTYAPKTKAVIGTVQDLLIAMRDMVHANDARFVVAMIPERQQVYPPEKANGKDIDYSKPQREFAAFFEQNEIEYIDLLPSIRAAVPSSKQGMFYKRDSHFTQTGYRVSGEVIAQYFLDTGVGPTPKSGGQ